MSQPARALPASLEPAAARALLEEIRGGLDAVVVGKGPQLRQALTCLVAQGHLLLEDVPGTGKTTLAESLAQVFGLGFARVQFTADLLPTDVLGAQVFRSQDASFHFRKGPIFHQLVLADELNRAPPRTQSALLEAMAHGQVSLDGQSHPLPRPFSVVAAPIPQDLTGTYPLPDSQLDRFLMRLSLGHPAPELEARLLLRPGGAAPGIQALSDPQGLLGLQEVASRVRVTQEIADYVIRLAGATRGHPELERGASTRAVLGLMAAARASALWEGRDFVTPGDVREVLQVCWAHRIQSRSAMQGSFHRDENAHLLQELVRQVPSPT